LYIVYTIRLHKWLHRGHRFRDDACSYVYFYLKLPRANMIDEIIEGSLPYHPRCMYSLYIQKWLHIMKDVWRSCTSTSQQKFWFGVQTMALPKLGRRYRSAAILRHPCSVLYTVGKTRGVSEMQQTKIFTCNQPFRDR
jgi:hypothetical protein